MKTPFTYVQKRVSYNYPLTTLGDQSYIFFRDKNRFYLPTITVCELLTVPCPGYTKPIMSNSDAGSKPTGTASILNIITYQQINQFINSLSFKFVNN